MNYPSDPRLNELAHEAEDIQWGIPFEGVEELCKAICRNDGKPKLPKHVRQFPKEYRRAMTGLYVGGKFRILAYCPNVETAARMADALVVTVDDYRKHGVKSDPKAAADSLNFPIESALSDLKYCEPLQTWISNLLAYLLSAGLLKEKGFKSICRPGRPQNVETIASLRHDIANLDHKLNNLQASLNALLSTQQTVIIYPSVDTTPAPPAIGWPLPAPAGDYPIITCGDAANAPKAT